MRNPIASLRKAVSSYNSYFKSIDKGLVCVSSDLDKIPDLEDISPSYIRAADMFNDKEIGAWLNVNNDAFGRAWGPAEYTENVIRHPDLQVTDTFMLLKDGKAVGIVSIGIYRRNNNIGFEHYIACKKSERNKGLGKHLVLYGYHKLKEKGIRRCETQTVLERKASLLIHFSYGFQPKIRLDNWNTRDTSSRLQRIIISWKLSSVYRAWKKGFHENHRS